MSNEIRHAELRRILASTVDGSRMPRRRVWLAAAAIAAFAVSGAATGGAVAALASSASDSPVQDTLTTLAAHAVGSKHAEVGNPIAIAANDSTSVSLGEAPSGADAIAVAVACTEGGTLVVAVDGVKAFDWDCNGDGGGLAQRVRVAGSGTHELSVTASSPFVLQVSWIEPYDRSSPAQQSELADGSVTADEYAAAFERYSTCMTEAGYPLEGVNRSEAVYDFSVSGAAVDSGVEAQCYFAEFQDVDVAWQISNVQ